jgi:signal transduction histidine kinase
VALPCTAFWVVGSRENRREAEVIASEPTRRAAETALRLAAHVGARLSELRRTESNRPYFHYQHLYHDPRGASAGVSVTPSPLSEGPSDPWLRGYFQVDGRGRLQLPTLAEDGAAAAPSTVDQVQLRNELAPVARRCRELLELPARPPRPIRRARRTPPAPSPAPRESPPPTKTAQQERVQERVPAEAQPQTAQIQVLDRGAYLQNQTAPQIFNQLTNRVAPSPLPSVPADLVVVEVGPFTWRTLTTPAGPALVALRPVTTPDDVLVQGFVVSPAGVAAGLASTELPARLVAGRARDPGEAPIPLDTEEWHVAVDAGPERAEAQARAGTIGAGFGRRFAVLALAAVLAGIAVVMLTYRAEELADQRSQLSAAAAHELRTPLAGLRLHAEMLADGLGDPGRRDDYARRIAVEVERLGRVVTNLLGFARLERGRLHVEPRTGDLGAAVRACVERQRSTLAPAGVEVALAVDPLPAVAFDPDALEQILINLLDNAEKYSRGAQSRRIDVSVAQQNAHVVLEVRDPGPGLSRRDQRRLFRPFSRAPGLDAPAGLGLGLALVRALARAHGGDVAFESTPQGTRVSVRLPVSTAGAPMPA